MTAALHANFPDTAADMPARVDPRDACLLASLNGAADTRLTVDLDALLDGIFEAFRAHSSPTYDRGDAHGDCGQGGMIVWKSSHPFIRQAIADALTASIRPPKERQA